MSWAAQTMPGRSHNEPGDAVDRAYARNDFERPTAKRNYLRREIGTYSRSGAPV